MAISKQQARKVRQPVLVGDHNVSAELSASATSETILLSSIAEKVTVQSSGNLAGNVEFSVNGVDFFGSTAFTANTPVTYSTHLVRVIKITWTSGTGRLHLVAR